MMSIEYLMLFSYATAICFMMSLTIGLAVVAVLRRNHLDNQQVAAPLLPKPVPQLLQRLPDTLDNTQTWQGKQQFSIVRETDTITQVPTEPPAVPVRYQQTLLYNDDTYNPCNDLETQPEKPPRQPAITGSL